MDSIPYCGLPPLAENWLTRWNFDPPLMAALAVLAILLGAALQKAPIRAKATGLAGYGLLLVAFVSPLCALTMSLFSARVGQHLWLVLVAMPLLAEATQQLRLPRFPLTLSAASLAVFMWFWHLPYGYALTLQSHAAYWAMHLSLIISAFALWRGLLQSAGARLPLVTLFTAVQMGLLGALLSFSNHLWHPWHLGTTRSFDLSPLADQALAGTLIWVAGGGLFALLTLLACTRWFRTNLADAGCCKGG